MKSKLFGVLLLIEAAALLLAAAVSSYYARTAGETDMDEFLITAGLTGAVGLLLYNIGRRNRQSLQLRDTFLVVAFAWVLFSVFGMLPFLLYGTVDNVTDAFFEAMSGFSTTGATILGNIDYQPHGILFWRSVMQWLGGLGVVVFTLAFIPSVAKGSKKKVSLYDAEAPGLSVEKLAPTMQATSRLLWIIYIALTLLCYLFYVLGPMNRFDAVCHALTTIATGGFSTHQASIGYFQSHYVEWVCIIFMLLSGVNFAMYHFLFNNRFDVILKNEELRWYLIAILGFTVVFMARFYFAPHIDLITDEQIASHPTTEGDRIRTSLFHVVALLSNTGYQGSNYDYDSWGRIFLIPTVLMMIVGGCAGSTSGGIKMVRVIVLFKYIKKTVYELIHKSSIYNVRISGQNVDDSAVKRVVSFFSMFILLFMVNVVLLTATGMELEDSAISFLTCFSNFGPGSGITGPSGTFDAIPNTAKWILSFDMLVGRLEIFTVMLLFMRGFWKAAR